MPRGISGNSAVVKRVLERIEACSQSDVSVLIAGETGTGKELCARMIHFTGKRADKPFITVNCAAIPENLLEAELFGHVRGAFTGANRTREGRFRLADGGTLFLDEVGTLPASQQVKILRATETGSFEPVGSNESVSSNVRIVSATNENLSEAVEAGRFREDLFFRLNVITVRMPSLRERRSDIPILLRDLLQEISERQGVPPPAIDSRAIAALTTFDYPGNIRELLHALEHAIALSRGKTIMLNHLPESFALAGGHPNLEVQDAAVQAEVASEPEPLADAVRRFELEYIRRVIDKAGGHRSKAAKILGISRKSLWKKLREDPD